MNGEILIFIYFFKFNVKRGTYWFYHDVYFYTYVFCVCNQDFDQKSIWLYVCMMRLIFSYSHLILASSFYIFEYISNKHVQNPTDIIKDYQGFDMRGCTWILFNYIEQDSNNNRIFFFKYGFFVLYFSKVINLQDIWCTL